MGAMLFVGAAACAKLHALAPAWPPLLGALALYTAGNLVLIRVVRVAGLGLAMSVSSVIQLIVVNLLAVVIFRERLTVTQYLGIALGVAAVALIVLPASSRGR